MQSGEDGVQRTGGGGHSGSQPVQDVPAREDPGVSHGPDRAAASGVRQGAGTLGGGTGRKRLVRSGRQLLTTKPPLSRVA